MNEKQIEVTDYGIYLLSVNKMEAFLANYNVKSKKVLPKFQNEHDLYLKSIEEGAWLPILPIDSIEYIVKVDGVTDGFDAQWELLTEIQGFNLEIGEDDCLWIGSFGNLLNWDSNRFKEATDNSISYETLDEEVLHSAFKFEISSGKYLVDILGYKTTNEREYPLANHGFLFRLHETHQFEGYLDPCENETYDFNISEI